MDCFQIGFSTILTLRVLDQPVLDPTMEENQVRLRLLEFKKGGPTISKDC